MRSLPVFALPFLATVLSAAQPGGQPSGAPFSSQQNALGGHYGAAGMGRPLGGITPPAQRREGSRRGAVVPYGYAPYGYAWYVPGYFDSYNYTTPSTVAVYGADTSPYVMAPPPPPAMPQPAAPPVIINNYYGAPPPGAAPPAEEFSQPAGAPLGPVENYYLIAYRDHSVYPVISYWVEDKTLHYVTTSNTHNQASLDLIDLDLTRTLNKVRNVPFSLPGQ